MCQFDSWTLYGNVRTSEAQCSVYIPMTQQNNEDKALERGVIYALYRSQYYMN